MVSDEEFSDLTDIDELSAEYEEPKSKKKGRAKGKSKAGEYRIRGALKAPRATTYSTEALYKQIHNGDINLEPEYQREVVWPESKQIGIIDSIYRNFYIPPVIFAVNAFDDGTETRTCIDGKQRLTSIHRFMEGLIPHKDAISGDKLWYRDNPAARGKSKKLLPEKFRNMFDAKAVVCVEYQDLDDADEREIFQRVQLGVALTPAEKLKVIVTPRANFVRSLQENFLNAEDAVLGGAVLAWDRTRGSDYRCLAQTIQSIDMQPKSSSIQGTEKWLSDPSEVSDSWARGLENTYRVFEALVRADSVSASAAKSVFTKISPIEFIMVGILVHRHKSRLTLDALGKAVGAMRADVRKVHDDIRNNAKVYKTMITFVDRYVGPALGRGEVCAADTVGAGAGSLKKAGGVGAKRKAAGRAYEDEDEEEDSDDDYAPAKKAAAPRKRANNTASAKKAAVPPTPPASAPPASPPVPAPAPAPNPVDVVRLAKERLAAKAAASAAANGNAAPGQMFPSPNSPQLPFSYNPAAGAHQQPQQPHGLPPFPPQYPPQGQQWQGQGQGQGPGQQGHGAAGVAAAISLEANLMAASQGRGTGAATPPAGSRVNVKSEPLPPTPFPAAPTSAGSGYEGSGRYGHPPPRSAGYEGSSSSSHRERRGHDYDYDEYGSGGRGDKRYRERDREHERGRTERRW